MRWGESVTRGPSGRTDRLTRVPAHLPGSVTLLCPLFQGDEVAKLISDKTEVFSSRPRREKQGAQHTGGGLAHLGLTCKLGVDGFPGRGAFWRQEQTLQHKRPFSFTDASCLVAFMHRNLRLETFLCVTVQNGVDGEGTVPGSPAAQRGLFPVRGCCQMLPGVGPAARDPCAD